MLAHSNPCWIGLDVALRYVDFFSFRADRPLAGRAPRQAAALAALARQWRLAGVETAVVEATGGLEALVWAALEAADIQVCLVSPGRVRSFARGAGVEAKTDRLDAQVLALFGERLQPRPTPLPAPAGRRFRDLNRQLGRLNDHRAQLRQRLLEAGKAKQLALIAVARRLLVTLNAMLRDSSPWDAMPAT